MTFGSNPNQNWNSCGNANDITMSDNSSHRKRSREDDFCEFMPLSKRIHNLHINNNLMNQGGQVAQTQNVSVINTEAGISSNSSSSSDSQVIYDPGMSSSQSSYYFDNKLLFELHLERLQRCGQQFPY